jgi:hypothetical protein
MGMNRVASGAHFHAHCEPYKGQKENSVKPRESSMNPIRPVAVERFDIKVQDESSGEWFSFLGNFVYVDGAYRFAGLGTLPFWSMPGGTHPKEP